MYLILENCQHLLAPQHELVLDTHSLWTRWFRRSWVISSCHCFRIPVLDGCAAVGIAPKLATLALSLIMGLENKIKICWREKNVRFDLWLHIDTLILYRRMMKQSLVLLLIPKLSSNHFNNQWNAVTSGVMQDGCLTAHDSPTQQFGILKLLNPTENQASYSTQMEPGQH